MWRDALEKEMKTVSAACKPHKHPTEGQVTPEEMRCNQQKCLIGRKGIWTLQDAATRGNPIKMSMFVDAAHAGDLINRRSQMGATMSINSAPITWHGKRQGTVEASAFGSAPHIGTEMNNDPQHKL